MAIEQKFTDLPTVSNSMMSDIICAVQGYVSPSVLGLSTQQTLQQIFNLFQSNVILSFAGSPNGNVAGTTYQFCWDSLNSTLYICVSSGTTTTAVWVRADINDGYTTTATAGATTTLTLISTYWQFFTGVLNQTVVMPVESTLSAGMTWRIVNNSSGTVTIQSSGLNTITTLSAGQVAEVTCILNSGTSAASWNANVSATGGGVTSIMGTTNQVIASSPTGAVTLSLPQDIATTSSPTFANVTFGVSGQIRGANGLPVMSVLSLASAVNWLQMNNQITGVNPGFIATGTDTDVGIGFVTKNAGYYTFASASTGTSVQWQTGTTYQHITNFVFANTAATRTLTYPDADGTIALTSGASGIVSPGLINQLAYYAAAGTTVSGLATANSGVLVTSAGGVPSISTTLPAGLTIPGYAHSGANSDITSMTGLTGVLQAPTFVNDSTGAHIIGFSTVASAVNYMAMVASSTGVVPGIVASGTDTNIGLGFVGKGTGNAIFLTTSNTGIQFSTGTANQHLTSFVFANTAASQTVTFPDATGTVAFTSSLPTPAALTSSNDTNVTISLGGTPATALLQATSLTMGWTGQLSLTRGGSNASLTASNGGIVYSTASAMAILAGTATANQLLLSGSSGAPSWSTSTYPTTNAINTLLYASSANVMAALATANSGVLVTSAGGVPSISTTLPNVALGTPTSITLTNGTGLPIAGITGLGTGVATALAANVLGSGGITLETDGTFTPTLTFGGAAVGLTYLQQNGVYRKIGNHISFTLTLQVNAVGSSTGTAVISGLPNAMAAGATFACFSIVPGITYTGTPIAFISGGSAVIGLQTYSIAGAASNISNTAFASGSILIISGTYPI